MARTQPLWVACIEREGRHRQRSIGVAINENVSGRSRSRGQSCEIEEWNEMVRRGDSVLEIRVIAEPNNPFW